MSKYASPKALGLLLARSMQLPGQPSLLNVEPAQSPQIVRLIMILNESFSIALISHRTDVPERTKMAVEVAVCVGEEGLGLCLKTASSSRIMEVGLGHEPIPQTATSPGDS